MIDLITCQLFSYIVCLYVIGVSKMKYLTFIIVSILYQVTALSQITRGVEYGEMYIHSYWYTSDSSYFALLHSWDNGESFSLMYSHTDPIVPGNMFLGEIVGDAKDGCVYNYGSGKFWNSYDYGYTWNLQDSLTSSDFTSGSQQNEVYKYRGDVAGTLYRSVNNGISFIYIRDSIKFPLEVGTQPGELYGLTGFWTDTMYLAYSDNYGVDFRYTPIDSSIIPIHGHGGYFPELHRGADSGEIYLVTWHLPDHYQVYFSNDFGETFKQQYVSDYVDLDHWGFGFTAGRQNGSFYITRTTADPTYTHTWLYVDYSVDTAKSFVTYFHDLLPTVGINKVPDNSIAINVYPNPFTSTTTLSYTLDKPTTVIINIFNPQGQQVEKITQEQPKGEQKVQWNAQGLPAGMYYFRINSADQIAKGKLLKIQ